MGRKIRILVLYIIVFICMLILFLLYLNSSEVKKTSYNNKNDILKNEAIKRGWIPEIIPKSAFAIIEIHDIDTNQVKGSFKYLEKDENKFISNLKFKNKINTWKKFQFRINKENNIVSFNNYQD